MALVTLISVDQCPIDLSVEGFSRSAYPVHMRATCTSMYEYVALGPTGRVKGSEFSWHLVLISMQSLSQK